MPCYSTDNVDAQRGRGVFDRSIRGLQILNAAGYGRPGSPLTLDLVYNPNGTFLAPEQSKLEVSLAGPLIDMSWECQCPSAHSGRAAYGHQ